jgi:hypothetical protein
VAVEPVTVVAFRLVMEAARGPVAAAVLGVATVAVPGPVIVVALGPVSVAVRGPVVVVVPGLVTVAALGPVMEAVLGRVTVTLLGVGTATGLTTGDTFSPQVLASLATATRGGGMVTTLTIRAIPTIPIRTMAIPIMAAACTMATHTMAIRTTKTVILALPPRRGFKPRSHNGAIIAVLLTVCGVRRPAMQFDHSKRTKVYQLPGRWIAG